MTQAPPKILSDEPADGDQLGGSHARIATAIAKLITDATGGKSIRLDGDWGAGKSTVVRMLMEKLEPTLPTQPLDPSQPQVAVYLYDAWVHSGDPLKQAFFRALLDKLEKREWLSATPAGKGTSKTTTRRYWNEQLDVLSSKVKRSERRERPKFSAGARYAMAFIAAFGVSLPYLLKLLDYLEKSVGALSVGLLAIVVTFGVVWSMPEAALNYFLLRNSDTKETETRGDIASTSIDFQDIFGKLLSAVVNDKARRLVVVVDNLDRIGESEIKEVWGLLRSFLDNPSFSGEPWFKHLWVVIPIANAANLVPSATGQEGPRASKETFLDKVFQVRFSLPPPMLQSWRKYMRLRLEEAFGQEQDSEYEDVQRIYDVYLTEAPDAEAKDKDDKPVLPFASTARLISTRVTPRTIVSFVNDLVAMRLEYGPSVSLALLAAYHQAAALRGRDENGLPVLNPRVVSILSVDRLQDAWAMLHYHTGDLDEASYIVEYPQLDATLRAGDTVKIHEEIGKSAGSSYFLGRYIYEDLPGLRGIALIRAASVLHRFMSDGFADENEGNRNLFSGRTIERFKEYVHASLSESTRIGVGDDRLVESVAALFDILPNRDETARLVAKLISSDGTRMETDQNFGRNLAAKTESQAAQWRQNLVALVQLEDMRQLLLSDAGIKLTVLLTAEECIDVMARFGDTELDWMLGVLESPPRIGSKIVELFTQCIVTSDMDDSSYRALQYYVKQEPLALATVAGAVIAAYLPSASPIQRLSNKSPQVDVLFAVSTVLGVGHNGIHEIVRNWLLTHVLSDHFALNTRGPDATITAKWLALSLWAWEGQLPQPSATVPNNNLPGGRAVRQVSQNIVKPVQEHDWVRRLHNVFSNEKLAEQIDPESFSTFVVRAKIFEILGYREISAFAQGSLALFVARSDALRRYLAAETVSIEEFAVQHVTQEELRSRFVADFLDPDIASRP